MEVPCSARKVCTCNKPILFAVVEDHKEYIYPQVPRSSHLPGRGLSMIKKVDGLGQLSPLHYGCGSSSIFLREAYTS